MKEVFLGKMSEPIRLLVIGDPHFKRDNVAKTDLLFEMTQQVLKTHRLDYVVVLGDTLHTHARATMEPHIRAHRYLAMIAEHTTLVLLIGNHDRRHHLVNMTDEHFFLPLKRWSRTIVVDQATTFDCRGVTFGAMPFVPEGTYLSGLGDMLKHKPRAIFSHQDFDHGQDSWPSHFPLGITGHDHSPHTPARNLIYVGSPFQHSYGDAPSRGIALFTFPLDGKAETLGTEPSEIDGARVEFIPLPIPMKVTIDVKASELGNFTPPEGVEVKLRVHATPSETIWFYRSGYPELFVANGIKLDVITDWARETAPNFQERREELEMDVRPFGVRLTESVKDDPLLKMILERISSK